MFSQTTEYALRVMVYLASLEGRSPTIAQIAAATAFLNGKPELLFDTVGFRVAADTTSTVSATRAANVRTAIIGGLKLLLG